MQTHAHLPDNKIKLFGSLTDFETAPSPLPFSKFLCHKVNHGANLLITHAHTHTVTYICIVLMFLLHANLILLFVCFVQLPFSPSTVAQLANILNKH